MPMMIADANTHSRFMVASRITPASMMTWQTVNTRWRSTLSASAPIMNLPHIATTLKKNIVLPASCSV